MANLVLLMLLENITGPEIREDKIVPLVQPSNLMKTTICLLKLILRILNNLGSAGINGRSSRSIPVLFFEGKSLSDSISDGILEWQPWEGEPVLIRAINAVLGMADRKKPE